MGIDELRNMESATRATLDAAVSELAAHRALHDVAPHYRPVGSAAYDERTAIYDRLDAARKAWHSAYDAYDAAYI